MKLVVMVVMHDDDGKEFDRTEWYTVDKEIGKLAGKINYTCYNEHMTNIAQERINT